MKTAHGSFASIGALLLTLAAAPVPASASHYVVDQGGGGDFTTLQAALDAYINGLGWRESVFVSPGTYAENLVTTEGTPHVMIGLGGASATTIDSLCITGGSLLGLIEGFSFNHAVQTANYGWHPRFQGCVFKEGMTGWRPDRDFEDCDFYGRTDFGLIENYGYPPFRSVRFHGGPFRLASWGGYIYLENCSFEGPADTLLFLETTDPDDPVILRSCRFSNARFGLVSSSPYGVGVDSCQFTDIGDAAIWLDLASYYDYNNVSGSGITDSRFEACGTALHWKPADVGGLYGTLVYLKLVRDTLVATAGSAAEIGPIAKVEMLDCVVDGSGGQGVVVSLDQPNRYPDSFPPSATIARSRFTNNGGTGLELRDTTGVEGRSLLIDACVFAGNDGNGLEVSGGDWNVQGCTAWANEGDGLVCESTILPGNGRLASNTSVLNTGDGFRTVAAAGTVPPPAMSIQRNLAVLNTDTGLRLPNELQGSFAFNDAWGNYLAQYVGAWGSLDSNLTVDPRFCDLSAGVAGLGLQQGSPCGPSGVYGLIGARGEECPNTAAVELPLAGVTGFSLRPSIARGVVEFVPPASGGEGRVELYDLAGRLVWRAPLGPATGVVRWRGEGERGRAAAGLYWARFTRGEERVTQRLVWLE